MVNTRTHISFRAGPLAIRAGRHALVLRYLSEQSSPVTADDVAAGTGLTRTMAYIALGRLQQDDLVHAIWDLSGLLPRRLYALTGDGLRVALSHRSPAA